ncbi:hypothetical protein G7Z17_g2011 [Cylindrodendrum hubeiense]|uniref:Aegerolysin n=1 Tax=Cylindrodendrum hubeiense TaxID=595255 RepID=A0A9P5LJM3_9HYPO|nr:hypothetical protein G7Z17_g2011 [Cylindrodendrum hubeiense]
MSTTQTETNVEVKAEAQWVAFDIKNRMKKNDISVNNAYLSYGKFYKGSKDREISIQEVDSIVIAPGTIETISSCGREQSPSGTTGNFDLFDGDTKICTTKWDCPWGSPTNNVEITSYDAETSDYSVVLGPWNVSGGAIGTVSITITRNG